MRPWEAQNALDAAVSAYTNISYLRQQIKPTHRVHGVFKGEDWAANGQDLHFYLYFCFTAEDGADG